jgi:endonuclease-3
VDDHLDSPGPVTSADLGVADQRSAVAHAGDETRESSTSAVHQVQPLVFAQWPVLVGAGGRVEQEGHLRDVVFSHSPLHLDMCHRRRGYAPLLASLLMVRPRSAKTRAKEVIALLASEYPGTAQELCALHFENPFQLLVATILSAQCTDERVNMTTPALFEAYPTPAALADAPTDDLERLIRPTGFFRAKSRSLIGMARAVTERYGGEVPSEMDDLTTLPGVGRKTANVLRSVAFDLPGLPVDTHVGRLALRLKLTTETDPVKVETDLNALVPPAERGAFSCRLILHGRQVCTARRAFCERCVLAGVCPSAGMIVPKRSRASSAK